MKKIIVGLLVIGIVGAMAFLQKLGLSQPTQASGGFANPIVPTTSKQQPQQVVNQTSTENLQVPTNSPTPETTISLGQYKNGSYTGKVTDAYYGNYQVRAIIKNGKISDIEFLQFPNDRNTSVYINNQAMPYLKQEAIQAQSANVNIVSGATQSSIAFKESLQSALDQARL